MRHVGLTLGIVLAFGLESAHTFADSPCLKLPRAPTKLGNGKSPDTKFREKRRRIVKALHRNCSAVSLQKEVFDRTKADLVFTAGQIQVFEVDGEEHSPAVAQVRQTKDKLDQQLDRSTAELDRLASEGSRLLHEYDRLLHDGKFMHKGNFPTRAIAGARKGKRRSH